jgi:hypothetical protein
MNTTPPSNIGELIKNYIQQVKADKKAVLDEYEKELSILESKKNDRLKEIDSKWNDIRKEVESATSEKPTRKKNKRMIDSEISEAIKNILSNNYSSMKTDELFTNIGIQRPRFDKYTKSPESIIKSEKIGKAFLWSLK